MHLFWRASPRRAWHEACRAPAQQHRSLCRATLALRLEGTGVSQANVQVREYRPGDEAAVVARWNRCLPADAISTDLFVARVLLDANTKPPGIRTKTESKRR